MQGLLRREMPDQSGYLQLGRSDLLAGGAFAAFERFTAGKTSAEAEFTAQPLADLPPYGCGVPPAGVSAEHLKSKGWGRPPGGGTQKERHDLRRVFLFGARGGT